MGGGAHDSRYHRHQREDHDGGSRCGGTGASLAPGCARDDSGRLLDRKRKASRAITQALSRRCAAASLEAESTRASTHQRIAGDRLGSRVALSRRHLHEPQRETLDSHKSAEHYLASKAQLFVHLPEGGAAVLNGCDPASALLEEIVPAGVRILRYGVTTRGSAIAPLDFGAREVALSWSGTRVVLDEGRAELPVLHVRAIGDVFAENALAAFTAARALGIPPEHAAAAIAAAPVPSGRFEVVAEAPHVVVDYAHTPDALTRTLRAARSLCRGKLSVVFGAGGQRDRGKRPLMGEASSSADRIVLTSDNPRNEDPALICAEIQSGIRGAPLVDVELDREEAIRAAVIDASANDVVVIAGKGHEMEQMIGSTRRRFSDQGSREKPRRRERHKTRPRRCRSRSPAKDLHAGYQSVVLSGGSFEPVLAIGEEHVERGERAVAAGDVRLELHLVRVGEAVVRVDLLLEHAELVADHHDLVEEDVERDALLGRPLSRA